MEMFGNCAHPNTSEFLRHSVHTYNLLQAEWQQQELSLTSTQSCSFSMVSSLSSGVLPGRWVQCGIHYLVNSSCTQLYKCSVCGDISCTWPYKCSVCFSTDVLGSTLKETSVQPPALPPKRSRIPSARSAASPPPMSPPPTSRLQQELHPKLDHTLDVDTSQTRFCICGISSHMWTPVSQGSVSVALVVTCGHRSGKVFYLWH